MGGFFDDVRDTVSNVATSPVANLATGGTVGMTLGGAALPGILSGPNAPPPPDVAARDAASLKAAQQTALLNNPNIINQYGSQTYTQNPDGSSTINQQLSPEQQALYKSNTANQQSSSDIYGRGLNSMSGTLGQPMDLSGAPANPTAYNPNDPLQANKAPSALDQSQLPAMPGSGEQTRQKVIDAMMSRSNASLGQTEDQMNSDLVAKGLRPGTEAYTREQDAMNRQRNDARQQAELAGGNAAAQQFGMDLQGRQQGVNEQGQQFGQELAGQGQNFAQQLASVNQSQGAQAQQYGQQADLRKQNIAEQLMKRQQPLNELNALKSGAQQGNPFAGQGYNGGANVKDNGGLLDQYNMDIYNQKVGGNNALIGGIASLGGAAIGALSDRRLKTDIKKVGTHKLGIGLYTWKYIDKAPKGLEKLANWGKYSIGVMADEVKKVMPEAVIHINGYDAVDYGMIGG